MQSAALPDNVTLTVGDIPELLPTLAPDAMTALVIVTRGHKVDQEALETALTTAAGYIGMIGSPGKVRTIFRKLLRKGVTPEALERVHAPVGLDLGAKTPDEIALSIAAELLMWRRGGTGASLREHAAILAKVRAEPTARPRPFPDAGVTETADGGKAKLAVTVFGASMAMSCGFTLPLRSPE